MNPSEGYGLRHPFNLGPPVINRYDLNPYQHPHYRGHLPDYAETTQPDRIVGNQLPMPYPDFHAWNVNPPAYMNNDARLINRFHPYSITSASTGMETMTNLDQNPNIFCFRQQGQGDLANLSQYRSMTNGTSIQKQIPEIPPAPKSAKRSIIQRNETSGIKHRKVNPLMRLLPPPSSQAKKSAALIKQNEAIGPKVPSRSSHLFHPVRFLSGSIDDILKWSRVTHKHPPLYETIGQLIGYGASTQYHSESRFLLQNVSQLHNEHGPKTKLNCTYFTMDHGFEIFPIGTIIRCVGRFNSKIPMDQEHMFQCVSVRKALDIDLKSLLEKVKNSSKVSFSQSIPHSLTRNEHWQEFPHNFLPPGTLLHI